LTLSAIFTGDYKRIQKYAKSIDADGCWRKLEYGGRQYRTITGAVLNWWEKSGKIVFQGRGKAATEFERRFKAKASAKGRLRNDANVTETDGVDNESRTVRKLRKANSSLRREVRELRRKVAKLRSG
jgi:hypothetical protein